jgi:hypothetical protein
MWLGAEVALDLALHIASAFGIGSFGSNKHTETMNSTIYTKAPKPSRVGVLWYDDDKEDIAFC